MRRLVAHARWAAVFGLSALGSAVVTLPAAAAPGSVSAEAAAAPTEAPRTPARLNESDPAAQRLRKILFADRWNRSRSLYELGDYQAAASYLMALVDQPVGDAARYEVQYRLADSLYHVGAYPGAVRYFEDALRTQPGGRYHQLINARLSELAARMGAIAEARREFARIAESGEARSRAAYTLGRALAPVAVTESVGYLRLVEPGTRYFAEARYHLGALAATQPTAYPLAVSYFAQARQALPAEAPRGPGVTERETERVPRLRELISLSLARIYADSGRHIEALQEYDRVQGIHRDAALLESAWVLLRLDELHPALENVQQLLRDRPESARVLEASLLVGYLTIEQGMFNDAYGHFEDTRRLLERLENQLIRYATDYTAPEEFYGALVADKQARLPSQIASWVKEGHEVRGADRLIEEVREVEREIRDIYRQLDEVEVMAAGPRGGPGDPSALDNLVRLDLSNALYRLQQRILELRLRPFIRHASDNEMTLLRLIRRVRADLLAIRHTPSDVNAASAGRQAVLAQLAQFLIQIHPEIGLATTKRTDPSRVAEVGEPLSADDFLRGSRRELAELSREVTLDDRWVDAALEYTLYLEDRLQKAGLRRLGVDERFDFVRRVSVLFRQSVELQAALRALGDALAEIQESILLEAKSHAGAERKVLAVYQEAARDINVVGVRMRGLAARRAYAAIQTNVAEKAVMADLGVFDTGWRVKELEDSKVRELLNEKQDRLTKLRAYYDEVVATTAGDGPYDGVQDLHPEALAAAAGSADSPYGRELIELSREVIALAESLELARRQQEQLSSGAEQRVLSPAEMAAERRRSARPDTDEGVRLELERKPEPTGRPVLPVTPGGQ